jgi:hypothetical protein
MTIRLLVTVFAIAAFVPACSGAPDGEPGASPTASAITVGATAPATGEPQLRVESGGGGKVYCPTCPIQCGGDGNPCPGGGGAGGGETTK